jgi:hypothetical protein
MNKEYYERLKYLASKHLNCALDDNEPGHIPADLKDRTYRWALYIYSNLYKVGDDTFFEKDRQMFLDMAAIFKKEHMINWTRDKLIELDKEKILHLINYLNDRINSTTSFFELKACLYVLRELNDNWFVVDPFILKVSPELGEYVINEKV